MDTTIIIAAYGAALSTVLAGTTIHNWWRDRASIVVNATVGVVMDLAVAKKVLGVDIINKGRRPVTICSVGIVHENGQILNILSNDLPKEITEGKSHKIFYDLTSALQSFRQTKPKYVFAEDQTGKEYKSKTDINKLVSKLI